MTREAVTASAPAKVILFGEHFVVYGEPAVVTAIDKRAYATAKLRRDNQIRIESLNLGISGIFKGQRFRPEKGGAKGAKLTGGGGGGCMIALAEAARLKRVAKAIERAGGTAFLARKTDQGARVES